MRRVLDCYKMKNKYELNQQTVDDLVETLELIKDSYVRRLVIKAIRNYIESVRLLYE